MKKSEHFINELNLIQNASLKDFTKSYLDNEVPTYFFEVGASSSGKYHPKFSQGKGGLVRHTKAVVKVCAEMLKLSLYAYMPEVYKDYAIMACILHDTAKYGIEDEENPKAYADHANNARFMVNEYWNGYFEEACPEYLLSAIGTHMGQWGADKPFTRIDNLVHMADYMASRSFIDIPEIVEEWNAVEEEKNEAEATAVEEREYNAMPEM